MNKFAFVLKALSAVICTLVISSVASAQATRTWVSGVGDDANPCSRTAPCKTFAGAISKTAAKGKINCLDPGGFGAVTITKSITIDCMNTEAGILAAGTHGVIINALSTDKVTLRGLEISGIDTGLDGIRFLAGGTLVVEKTWIHDMQNGINVGANQTANVEVLIRDVHIENNLSVGMFFSNASSGLVRVAIEKTSSFNNAFGVIGRNNSRVTAFDSNFSGNSTTGVLAEVLSAGPTAEINVDTCRVTGNGTGLHAGTNAQANQGTLRVANSFISHNTTGVNAGNGQALTFNDNKLQGNTAPGAFTLPALGKN